MRGDIPTSDVYRLFHRLLAEERDVLSAFIRTQHKTMATRFESYLIATENEAFRLMPPPLALESGEPFAKMPICSQIQEPVADDGRVPDGCCEVVGGLQVLSSMGTTRSLAAAETDWKEMQESSRVLARASVVTQGTTKTDLPVSCNAVAESVALAAASSCKSESERSTIKESAQDTDDAPEMITATPSCQPTTIRARGATETSWGKWLVKHPAFEIGFACLIFFNAVIMGLEQQYVGFDTGFKLQVPGYTRPAREMWPQAEACFILLENFFGIIFTLEVILKLTVFRWDFFLSLWNLYDSVIIMFWLIQNLSLLQITLHPLILRLARMGRLLRLLRFAKAFQVFDVLHLLVHSMIACMTALMWSMLFLCLVMLGTSIVIIHLMHGPLQDEAIPVDQRIRLFRYFGNFSNGMFALYELTMANWVPIARCVVDNVGDWSRRTREGCTSCSSKATKRKTAI
eukprot:TRINITY_DN14806_c1_g1_i1.p1 TRINITY_DN14806_c1_g1~~TRINITY_DN14806_c1_g1_i1.p1  ORF type:complete len:459 (+),score=46.19 TRINITY_DN14806_c1_g1_i1:194-1570(+)